MQSLVSFGQLRTDALMPNNHQPMPQPRKAAKSRIQFRTDGLGETSSHIGVVNAGRAKLTVSQCESFAFRTTHWSPHGPLVAGTASRTVVDIRPRVGSVTFSYGSKHSSAQNHKLGHENELHNPLLRDIFCISCVFVMSHHMCTSHHSQNVHICIYAN